MTATTVTSRTAPCGVARPTYEDRGNTKGDEGSSSRCVAFEVKWWSLGDSNS